jgi:hypothetical protein
MQAPSATFETLPAYPAFYLVSRLITRSLMPRLRSIFAALAALFLLLAGPGRQAELVRQGSRVASAGGSAQPVAIVLGR